MIVGVNDDVLVICLKGVGWLINLVDWCMVVFVGFGVVDWVVSFVEDIFECLFE